MEPNTKYRWNSAMSIEKSTDAELFAVMCEESPVVKQSVFGCKRGVCNEEKRYRVDRFSHPTVFHWNGKKFLKGT
ncbi:uncharacterized protein EAF01_002905 [Botrytis porri]|uniref:uncharacterized protein n=1 Tax=Botrytis porri TaxID=87229 RepID=UPI001900F5C8|nr:uncharacterized protein EAF01_002905 [Botrytis porri]KAF7911398.1 hypothetical protein EAF01_002905 [Botrytis porri]